MYECTHQIAEPETGERVEWKAISPEELADAIRSFSSGTLSELLRGATRTNSMALTHLSLHEAERIYPHISSQL